MRYVLITVGASGIFAGFAPWGHELTYWNQMQDAFGIGFGFWMIAFAIIERELH